MAGRETVTVYFERGGPADTDRTLALARARADELGIRDILVASSSGDTGARAAKVFAGRNLIVVNGLYPDKLDDAHRQAIEDAGARILFCGHAFGMLGRAVKKKFGAIQVDEIVAHVLRLFSEGVKVAAEITCMATDASLITPGSEVMAIGGSGRGADTAAVIRAARTQEFFDIRILEIICKPRE
jgi:hypothetical protein